MLNLYGVGGILIEAQTQGHFLLSRTIITATGNTTYTTPVNVWMLFVQCIGGGGTGPNTGNSTAGNIIVSSGGNGGGYACQWVPTSPGKTFTSNISGATLSSSFKSSDAAGPTIYCLAPGGGSGTTMVNGATELFAGVGTNPAGISAGSPAVGTTEGPAAHRVNGTTARAGKGGNGPFGGAAVARITHGNGTAGGQYGGGGSGGLSINAAGATTAGTGGPGVTIVWEFT